MNGFVFLKPQRSLDGAIIWKPCTLLKVMHDRQTGRIYFMLPYIKRICSY